MFRNIYKNKTVFVTGHTGFKGSWLSIWLRELGANVIGYSLEPPSEPNNFNSVKLLEKITHIHGDVRNLDGLIRVFREYKPEFIFHLAAQPLVRLSYEEPKLTFDTNVGGSINVFEAVRATRSVKVLVNITSDKCYENKEWIWGYRENDPMGGHDPYSASKGCAELAFNAYLRSYFAKAAAKKRQLGAASVRAGNVVGGGDWGMDRLVPDCIRALSRDKIIGIRNPNAVRPWQHVLEPLSGYLWIGALLKQKPCQYSGSWNFGPDDRCHMSVECVVGRLIQYWGKGSWKDLSDQSAPHEAKLLKLTCDKAHAELNWYSILNTDECLKMTVDWYRKYYSKCTQEDMYYYSVDQIKSYAKKASQEHLTWADRELSVR
jgi:CDP-glucose 4,6-dehydratase